MFNNLTIKIFLLVEIAIISLSFDNILKIRSDDYIVYNLAYHELFSNNEELLLYDSTFVKKKLNVKSKLREVIQDSAIKMLYLEFNHLNEKSYKLHKEVEKETKFKLIHSLDSVTKSSNSPEEFWKNFAIHYPNFKGIAKVSKPAYYKNYSLVYMEYSINVLNGAGFFFVLEKQKEWKVIYREMVWVS